jgi:lipopolysaccharide export LptBFGC system permease protein LptF
MAKENTQTTSDTEAEAVEAEAAEEKATEAKAKAVEAKAANNKVSDLEKKIADLERILMATADAGRLHQYNQKNKGKEIQGINVSEYKNKIVVSWSNMTKNDLRKGPTGVWIYDQKTTLTYLDGEKEEVDYLLWQRDRVRVPVKVLSVIDKVNTGEYIYSVVSDVHGKFDIDIKFVN